MTNTNVIAPRTNLSVTGSTRRPVLRFWYSSPSVIRTCPQPRTDVSSWSADAQRKQEPAP